MQLALLAQRCRWPVPRFLRAAGRFLLSRLRAEQPRIKDWSSPLVIRGEAMAGALPVSAYTPSLSQTFQDRACAISAPNASLNCLVVTAVLDAGGMDEFAAFLARRLPGQGMRAFVMVTDQGGGGRLMKTLRREGIPVIEQSGDGRQWLADHRPDVISAHAPPDWLVEAAHDLCIPVVETLHAVPTPIGTDWRAEASRSRHIRYFVAVSELVRRQYLRGNPGFERDAIVTIPNGFNDTHRPIVDRAAARGWLGLDDEFMFLCLARHVMQKNAYGLISAFSDVAKVFPQAHLLVAGRMDDPSYMEQLLCLRKTSGAAERIHLRDNMSDPSILLAAADCFVMNSFFEGWPLASMEALCAGLPIIMSDVGGAREQVGSDRRFGYVVSNPAGDPEVVTWESAARERFRLQRNRADLIFAMNDVIANREHWAARRPEIVKEARGRFDVEACVAEHASVLRKAAAG